MLYFLITVKHQINGHTFCFPTAAKTLQAAIDYHIDEGSYYELLETAEITQAEFFAALED